MEAIEIVWAIAVVAWMVLACSCFWAQKRLNAAELWQFKLIETRLRELELKMRELESKKSR